MGVNHKGDLSVSEREPTSEVVQPVEIERKFLVTQLPENLADFDHKTIRQGYMVIGEDGSEARLRDKAGSYTLTVKSKGELSRGEWETPITEEQFVTLWGTTAGKRVEKTRYAIPYDGHTIELDIYEGDLAGLVSAEVEFDSVTAAEAFEVPDWFADDVTANSGFKNQNLALKGLPN